MHGALAAYHLCRVRPRLAALNGLAALHPCRWYDLRRAREAELAQLLASRQDVLR